jgi:hypothetical protein
MAPRTAEEIGRVNLLTAPLLTLSTFARVVVGWATDGAAWVLAHALTSAGVVAGAAAAWTLLHNPPHPALLPFTEAVLEVREWGVGGGGEEGGGSAGYPVGAAACSARLPTAHALAIDGISRRCVQGAVAHRTCARV